MANEQSQLRLHGTDRHHHYTDDDVEKRHATISTVDWLPPQLGRGRHRGKISCNWFSPAAAGSMRTAN